MSCIFRINCRHFSLLGYFLLVFQFGQAQSSEREAITDWLRKEVSELGGRAVLMIYKSDSLIYTEAVNAMNARQKMANRVMSRKTNRNADEPLQDLTYDTRINIASCSKWLSAALVMTFVDEGKLRLDDTIGRYLPVMTQHGKGMISIRDCLSHLTGIYSGGLSENRNIMKAASMEEAVEWIAGLPMEGKPGKIFHYSSVGLQLAAAVVEKISGQDFITAFNERIAIPCGMVNTDFGMAPVPLAAGGARSTARDYLHFTGMIMQNGMWKGNRVLSEKMVDQMQRNHAAGAKLIYSPAEAGNWGYGLGAWVMDETDTGTRSRAVCSPGLFGSFPWVDNDRKYAAVLFTLNLKTRGRAEKYRELKRRIDNWMDKAP